MKNVIVILVLLLATLVVSAPVANAQSTVTVTADAKAVLGSVPSDSSLNLCLQLTDQSGQPVSAPQVIGVGVIVLTKNCAHPTNGHWSIAGVYTNDSISVAA